MTKVATLRVSEKQHPILKELVRRRGEWLRALELGPAPGTSGFLTKLIAKGLVERKLRFGSIMWERGTYLYTATSAGIKWIEDHD